jgi:small conductance mechanosensitive channel
MDSIDKILDQLLVSGVELGKSILTALAIYIIGRYVIKGVNKVVARVVAKRDLEPSVRSFLGSLVNITLTIFLIIAVISALGIETTSFAALLASAGVAIGMALSGNLQNFAGGLIILLIKPFKVGDFIEAQGYSGTVKEIQIFNTILNTPDNKTIIIPNGGLSTGSLNNYSKEGRRRVDWKIGIAYGDDFDTARKAILELLAADKRVFDDPAPFVVLSSLADSAIEITVRVWTASENYWGVLFDFNEQVYKQFDKYGLHFPYPQVDVHMIQDNQ